MHVMCLYQKLEGAEIKGAPAVKLHKHESYTRGEGKIL